MRALALFIQMLFVIGIMPLSAQGDDYRPNELPEEFLISDNPIFKAALTPHIQSLTDFIDQSLSDFDFLCLGEYHSDSQRKLYASVLSRLSPRTLAIEDQPLALEKKLKAYQSGEPGPIKLLGADFLVILEALKLSQTKLLGIESSTKQDLATSMERIKTGRQRLSRDGFIALNLEESIRNSSQVVALYGSKHCGNMGINFGFSVPFYRLLKDRFPEKKFVNTLLLEGSRGIEPLQVYLKAFGLLKEEPVVIKGGVNIDPKTYNYRSDIRQLFEAYDAIIVAP